MTMTTIAARPDATRIARRHLVTALLCGLVLLLDGFDTQAISYAAPAIAQDWHLSRAALGPIFSAGLAGLMAGYLALSPLADRFGPKRMVVASTAAFAVATLATVLARDVPELIALRFLTGLGLGAGLPAAVALTGEYSPPRLRATFVLAIYVGFSLGFVAAGAATAWLLPLYGWTALFWVGAILPLLLCPVLAWALPESQDYLLRRRGPPAAIMRQVVQGDRRLGTLLLWLVFAINLGAFYLLQSWLPTLLTELHRGLDLVTAATALSTTGGIVAAFVVGPAMDRLGACRVLAVLYAVGAIGVALLGPALAASPTELMLTSFFAGFCISGGQKSAIALATLYYPAAIRSTGLGLALGVGRAGGIGGPLLAGALLAAGWSPTWLFGLVAAAMVAAALATAALGRLYRQSDWA